MIALNQSTIQAADCPRRGHHAILRQNAARARGLSAKGGGTGPAAVGTVVHEFAWAYIRHCLAAGVQTDLDAVPAIMERVLAESGLPEQDVPDATALCEVLASCEMAPPPADPPPRLEANLSALDDWTQCWPNDPRAAFHGTIDRLDFLGEAAGITDYKTYRRIRTGAEAESDLQAKMYAGLVFGCFEEIQEVKFRWVYLRHRGVEKTVSFSRADFPAIKALFAAKAKAIRDRYGDRAPEDSPEPKPAAGTACLYCEVAATCPLVAAGVVRMIQAREDARDAASRLLAMEAAKDNLRDLLRPWVDLNGALDIGGMVLDFHQEERLDFPDAEAVAKAMLDAGIPREKTWIAMNPGKSSIQRALGKGKKMAPVYEAIDKLAVVKKQTRFEFRDLSGE